MAATGKYVVKNVVICACGRNFRSESQIVKPHSSCLKWKSQQIIHHTRFQDNYAQNYCCCLVKVIEHRLICGHLWFLRLVFQIITHTCLNIFYFHYSPNDCKCRNEIYPAYALHVKKYPLSLLHFWSFNAVHIHLYSIPLSTPMSWTITLQYCLCWI